MFLLCFLSPLDEADRGNVSFDLPITNRDQDIASYSHMSQEMGIRMVHTHLAGFKPIKWHEQNFKLNLNYCIT